MSAFLARTENLALAGAGEPAAGGSACSRGKQSPRPHSHGPASRLRPSYDAVEMQRSRSIEAELSEAWEQSEARRFGLSRESFVDRLRSILGKYLTAGSEAEQVEFISRLHLRELALAQACAAGNEAAWNDFVREYSSAVASAARAIARDAVVADELASSLYGELFIGSGREPRRVSRLRSYSGIGSLAGWLRAVLAQTYINQWRRTNREVSLEDENSPEPAAGSGGGAGTHGTAAISNQELDPKIAPAVEAALRALPAEDRFVLACYYLDDRTLLEIARTLGVHQSTISRRIDRSVRALRGMIAASLKAAGMSERQVEEALELDVRDLTLDVRAALQADAERAFQASGAERS